MPLLDPGKDAPKSKNPGHQCHPPVITDVRLTSSEYVHFVRKNCRKVWIGADAVWRCDKCKMLHTVDAFGNAWYWRLDPSKTVEHYKAEGWDLEHDSE
jgi:hypothetical protein